MTETASNETETPPETTSDTRYVPLERLWLEHDKWVNPRTIINEQEVAALAVSVKEKGVLVPLATVQVRTPTGGVISLVLDGQQRVLASRQVLAAEALIPVRDVREGIIEELTWDISDDLLGVALDIGIRRTQLSSFELCETAERMRNRGRTGTEIARKINKSESWVSRMCKARLNATNIVLARWRRGELTDEQFKDLAQEKDPVQQVANAKQVVEARKSGDKSEARMLAKEGAASAKAREPKPEPKPAKGKASDKAPAKGKAGAKREPEQIELLAQEPPDAPPPPPKAVPLAKAVLDDIVAMGVRRTPVHDYVRGVIDMAGAALGVLDMSTFAKPWAQYLSRLGGTEGKKAGKKKAGKKAKRAKK